VVTVLNCLKGIATLVRGLVFFSVSVIKRMDFIKALSHLANLASVRRRVKTLANMLAYVEKVAYVLYKLRARCYEYAMLRIRPKLKKNR